MSILLLALSLGLFRAMHMGWRWVGGSPSLGPPAPTGEHWFHVVAAPHPLPPGQPLEDPVGLWWNPLETVVAVVIATAAGLLLMWLTMLLMRAGVIWAHRPPYRREQRMTAAIHYSTAWSVPVVLGAAAVGLRPLSYMGTIARWSWCPQERVFLISAAVLGGFGIIMWWFWLVRLGATAPARTRGRVIVFFTLGAPLVIALAATVWWYGLDRLYDTLYHLLDVYS